MKATHSPLRGKSIVRIFGSIVLVSTFAISGPVAAVAAVVSPISSDSEITIEENTSAVVDVDAANATLFEIVTNPATSPDSALFAIDSASGVLTFIDAPDYETPLDGLGDNIYLVKVRASDNASMQYQTISVTVTDVLATPVYLSTASANFAENTSIATVAKDVNASDADAAPAVTYSIVAVGDDALSLDSASFAIDPTTGELTFLASPDFELPTDSDANNTYVVVVRVSDGISVDVDQTITITVTDTNDHNPAIGSTATANFAENTSIATTAKDVNATDADAIDTVTYSIVAVGDDALSLDSGSFAISSTTGVLTFLVSPNFEVPTDSDTNNTYVVVVRVSDGTNDVDQTVTITVTDTTDVPVIGSTATANFAENTSIATVAKDVNATDADVIDSLVYSIVAVGDDALSLDSASFAIDSDSGELTFLASPDFELPTDSDTNNTYVVVVRVSDGTNDVDQTVTITVTPANDHSPVIGSTDSANFAENTSIATTAKDVNATDADAADTLTYSIVAVGDDALSLDSGSFAISSTTGVLTFLVSPDFEVPTDSDTNNTYVVVVRVSDGTNDVDQTVTITVTNVNEAPTITSSRSLFAAENGSAVGILIGTDQDAGATQSWSISGGADRAKFTINPVTGRLSLTGFQDFENPIDADFDGVFLVQVRLTDGTNIDAANFQVTITDLVEGPALNGTNGTDGTNGTNGTNGTDGTNGTNGTNGTDGTNGADGAKGATGAAGAAGTQGPAGAVGPQGPAGDVVLVFEYKVGSQSLSKLSVRKIKTLNEFKLATSVKIVAYRKAGTSVKDSVVQAKAMAAQIRLSYPTMKVTVSPSPSQLKACKPVGNQCMSVVLSK